MEGEQTLEQIITREYRLWKRNAPFMYDLMITKAMEWPSLSVDWISSVVEGEHYDTQKLVIGTHTDK
jgi:histone-binding protein RBBP4